MFFQINRELFKILVLCALFNLYSSVKPDENRREEERLVRIRQIVYSGVFNLTSQLVAVQNELTNRKEFAPGSQTMSGHLLDNWMKIVNGEDVDKPTKMDQAFAYTIQSLNETLPQVIQELYLASGTMSRQDLEPQFYQGTLGFISAAVFGIVFYEMIRNLPSVIRRVSNWMHNTQDSSTAVVHRLLYHLPRALYRLNEADSSFKNMELNSTHLKNFSFSSDSVKSLYKLY